MNSFWTYLFGTFYSPRNIFTKLLSDSKQLSLGIKAVLLMGILYTLTTIGYAVIGATPLIPPVIVITAGNYYFYEIFFMIPVFFLGWLFASCFALFLSKLFKGSGTFKAHLAVMGFALNIPWYITWLVDTVIALLYLFHILTQKEWAAMISQRGTWQAFTYIYPLVALIWLFILVAVELKVVEKLHWWQSIANSIFTVLVLQILMTIFIR